MCEKGEKENTKNTQLKNAGNGRGSQTEGPRQKDAQMHITQKRKQEGTCQFGSKEEKGSRRSQKAQEEEEGQHEIKELRDSTAQGDKEA